MEFEAKHSPFAKLRLVPFGQRTTVDLSVLRKEGVNSMEYEVKDSPFVKLRLVPFGQRITKDPFVSNSFNRGVKNANIPNKRKNSKKAVAKILRVY